MSDPIRDGEITLPFDPGAVGDARVTFIGRIRTPWSKGNAPRNLIQAREAETAMHIELTPDYRPALEGLEAGRDLVLLYWMDQAPRNIVVQNPRHSQGTKGTFALRSPARPNPIALAVVKLLDIDHAAGTLTIDAIDCFDGTPLLDIKPWMPSIDVVPGWRPED